MSFSKYDGASWLQCLLPPDREGRPYLCELREDRRKGKTHLPLPSTESQQEPPPTVWENLDGYTCLKNSSLFSVLPHLLYTLRFLSASFPRSAPSLLSIPPFLSLLLLEEVHESIKSHLSSLCKTPSKHKQAKRKRQGKLAKLLLVIASCKK